MTASSVPGGEGDVDATLTTGAAPPAEVDIDEALVARLLAEAHPDLAHRPLRRVAEGWDNVTYRLGEDLAVRLPRRSAAVPLIEHEQAWLPSLARRVPVPVPEPVAVGSPGGGYPWPWSVVRWVPGTPAAAAPLGPSAAASLGAFLAALHGPAPDAAPRNPHRGVALAVKDEGVRLRLERLGATGGLRRATADALRARWDEALSVPVDVDAGWLHSDLHPKNVLGRDGALAGVVDWGDLGVGDPATDLATAWMHLDPVHHGRFWSAYGEVTEATRRRAEGWALFFGVVLSDTAADDRDPFGRIGRTTLARLLDP